MNSQNLPIKIKARGNFKLNLENRFTPEEKEEIAVRIGTFQTDEEIKEWAEARKKTITKRQIVQYRSSKIWAPIIERHRERWREMLLEVPLANKRKRIEEFSSLFEKALKEKDHRLAGMHLRGIREEMEGDRKDGRGVTNQIYNVVQFNSLSDSELEERRLQIVSDLKHMKKLEHLRREIHASTIRASEKTNDDGASQSEPDLQR